jgi:electron transfer flavoprotein alpha subunit
MTILLLAEHDNTTLHEATAKALTAALALGQDVDILVAGVNADAVAASAAALGGIRKVLLANADAFAGHLAEPIAATIVSLAGGYTGFVAPATATGRSVLPRVAAALDVMQVSDVVKVVAPDTFVRPIYAGNALETVQSTDARLVMTVRVAAFPPAASAGSAPIEAVEARDPALSRFIEDRVTRSDRPDLANAKIVVAGGRALGSKENFDRLILPLADRLNAAVGASRAAVDAGFAPNDWQVGQTGKIVAPGLYIAIGISGAIQHLAGMTSSKVIVAINQDAEAPIFKIADYGLVGDLFAILPELEKQLL